MSKGTVWISIGKVLAQINRQGRTSKTACILFSMSLIRQIPALMLRLPGVGGQVAD